MEGSLAGLTCQACQGQSGMGIASGSLTPRFPATTKKKTPPLHGRSRRRTEPPFELVTLVTFSPLSILISPGKGPQFLLKLKAKSIILREGSSTICVLLLSCGSHSASFKKVGHLGGRTLVPVGPMDYPVLQYSSIDE